MIRRRISTALSTYNLVFSQISILTKKRQTRLLFHSIGLSCLGAALLLQGQVITNIVQQGFFRAIEQNPTILSLEIFLTLYGIIYFAYLVLRFLSSANAFWKISN